MRGTLYKDTGAAQRCKFSTWSMNPLQGSRVSRRWHWHWCGAKFSTWLMSHIQGSCVSRSTVCGDRACRNHAAVARCRFLGSPMNPFVLPCTVFWPQRNSQRASSLPDALYTIYLLWGFCMSVTVADEQSAWIVHVEALALCRSAHFQRAR